MALLMEAFLIAFVTLRGFPVSIGPSIITASISGGLAGVTALGQVKIAQKALTPGEEGPAELESGQEQLLPDSDGKGV